MGATMLPIIALVSASAALSVFPTASRTKLSSSAEVQVWDNVLPNEGQRAALHEYSSKLGLGHRCFSRPLSEARRNNVIERTLDAILAEMEDGIEGSGRMVVEYWTRQEWRHIEAHADVDENLSKRIDQRSLDDCGDLQSKYPTTYLQSYGHRYPAYGHVLYLQVGTDVRGPTCIFHGRSTGGDLLRATHDLKSSRGISDDFEDREEVQLSIVPAVSGRLLRFDGRDLHAVPRPTDLWMIPFVKGSADYEPREVWGRSVILFNIWPSDEEPPLDVPLDRIEDDLQQSQTMHAFCNTFRNWKEVRIFRRESSSPSSDSQTNESVKVWLLGNERRRDHPLRTVSLLAPAVGGRDAVREALEEKSRVTELWLRQQ